MLQTLRKEGQTARTAAASLLLCWCSEPRAARRPAAAHEGGCPVISWGPGGALCLGKQHFEESASKGISLAHCCSLPQNSSLSLLAGGTFFSLHQGSKMMMNCSQIFQKWKINKYLQATCS